MGATEELVAVIKREAGKRLGEKTEAQAWYDQDGDCIFWYREDVPFKGVRVADLVTVFEALDDGRPVGLQIKGIRSLMQQGAKVLNLALQKREVNLLHLVTVAVTFSRELVQPELYGRACASASKVTVPSRELQFA